MMESICINQIWYGVLLALSLIGLGAIIVECNKMWNKDTSNTDSKNKEGENGKEIK